MKLLAVDTSAKVTSVSIIDENKIAAEFCSNTKLTHSQALMPMLNAMLSCSKISIDDIDCFACAAGPGSFTGLRIGIAAIKGLAFYHNKPCVSVSTLEALAYNLKGFDGIICAAMDARCNQVYTSIYESDKANMKQLYDDRALKLDELFELIKNIEKNIFFVGDGADLCYNRFKENCPNVFLASNLLKLQHSSSVGLIAFDKLLRGETVDANSLVPIYLRLPQAQRELKLREERD